MMLGWKPDLRLVAEHLLGARRLADPRQFDRPQDVRQLVDGRVGVHMMMAKSLMVYLLISNNTVMPGFMPGIHVFFCRGCRAFAHRSDSWEVRS